MGANYHLRKALTWRDGVAVAITLPTGLLVTVGYAIGADNG